MIRTWLVAATLALAVDVAHADDIIKKGAVVKIDRQEIYVNLGSTQGITDGAQLRIKRPLRLRHPVTRAAIQDWVPVGAATITQTGGLLSRALVGGLVDQVKVGDVIEVYVEGSEPAAPEPTPVVPPTLAADGDPPAPQPAKPVTPATDPETAAVLGVFAAHTGAPLETRIAGWEHYLSMHGTSRYAVAVREDLVSLQALREQLRPVAANHADRIETVEHDQPHHGDGGMPIPLVFVLSRPEQVASGYLHYRSGTRQTYSRVLLRREHDIYLRGSVPAEVVKAPGVEYFVEVSTPDGSSGLAAGTPTEPLRVEVKRPPLGDQLSGIRDRTSVALSGEGWRSRTVDGERDQLYRANIDFAYELDTPIRRIGVGYGVIGGDGGALIMAPRRTGFHYGNADVEVGTPTLAVGSKLIAGVGREGFGMGVEGRARLGAYDGTNIGARAITLPEIGWLAEARLGAALARPLLLGISVGATTQPDRGNDVAARLATDLEWVGHSHLRCSVRVNWQGLSTQHGGFGGGAAARLIW